MEKELLKIGDRVRFMLPSLSGVSVRKKEEHHSSRMSTERKTI